MKPWLLGLMSLPLMIPLLGVKATQALEINVSGNGDGSANEVSTQVEQTTTVVQQNQTEITNEVAVEANTGDNSVSNNSGETTIETGNISVESQVENQVNQSVVEVGCCEAGQTELTIINNGNGSTNEIELTQLLTTEVQISQEALIRNLITGIVNSGNNLAVGNLGDVMIETGSIKGLVELTNQLNRAYAKVWQDLGGDLLIKIANNGSGSDNQLSLTLDNGVIILINHEAVMENVVSLDLNTGGNEVEDNLGDVFIKTGDIDFAVVVENEVNESFVEVDQCCEEQPQPPKPPEPPIQPPQPPGGNGGPPGPTGDGNGNGNGGNGGVGGAVLGESLPITGTMDYLLAFLANIIMFLLGVYLRLKSGRAPAKI